jgi:hypothetical protein
MEGVQRIRAEVVARRRPAAPPQPPLPAVTAPPVAPVPTEAPAAPLEFEPTSYGAGAPVPAPAPDVIAAPVPGADTAGRPVADAGARDAARLYAAGRWEEAVGAYRRLAQTGGAAPDDFAAWAESARQAGALSQVVEALTAAARWSLDRGDHAGARRAAEEMLLLDPDSSTASDILERVGTSLPRS